MREVSVMLMFVFHCTNSILVLRFTAQVTHVIPLAREENLGTRGLQPSTSTSTCHGAVPPDMCMNLEERAHGAPEEFPIRICKRVAGFDTRALLISNSFDVEGWQKRATYIVQVIKH